MSQRNKSFLDFEGAVGELLTANGFGVTRNAQVSNIEFDFIAKIDNEEYAIEVKYYRTERAQVSLIQAAASRLIRSIKQARIAKGMLVVACSIDPDLRLSLELELGLVVVDRGDLLIWARQKPEIIDELNAMLEIDQTIPKFKGRGVSESISNSHIATKTPDVDTRGTDLCTELRELKRGRESWSTYEKLCERILRYLFPNDLHGWQKQQRTDDGLNRFDFICRLRVTTDFWKFLVEHLDSRYILFEFKNYSGKIKQGQILTTEKYLLERALRRVAIIFCRTGAEKGAIAMTQGAMREHGKLMLILDDEKVCKMLLMKEAGEDPSDLLFEVADDFLLSLPR